MDLNAALALAAATAILVAIPGPNVALIVANTLARGFRFGAMTVLGTTIGVALQVGVVVLGLAALLEVAASALTWLKWAGVAYLLYLGWVSWRQGVEELRTTASLKPARTLFLQGLMLACVNPKTLLFNVAFLPQFVSADAGGQALLAAASIYLGVFVLGDMAWAATARAARPLIFRLGRLRHRLTGCLFFGSGIGLALSRTDR